MKKQILFVAILQLFYYAAAPAQSLISYKQIPDDKTLLFSLKPGIPELKTVYEARDKNEFETAVNLFTDYLKEEFADRYFFSWKNFRERFAEYKSLFPKQEKEHIKIAAQHSSMFPADTKWKLPFKNLKGEDVSSYELRHLARQQKSYDAVLSYYFKNEDPEYLDYFIGQVKSLNAAFARDEYDKEGNGIYENFRGGLRMHNWLFVHNAFLASEKYTREDQILLLKTFLHTAASLQRTTKKFSYGNHHTKGLMALFQLSVMFPEFAQSGEWQKQAIDGLVLHLQREINDDGFQSERSVHYHMGDIDNYFWVYQIASINSIKLPEEFDSRFRMMFDALVKLSQPDKCIHVLQDDTDSPYKDKNDISNAMTIGTILFQDPVYNYFTKGSITADLYWYFKPAQTPILKTPGKQPAIGSTALPTTGYYIMRNGWNEDDLQMVVSAGLYDKKPDHQHGDMLGVTAYAFGNEILPGYIVRYPDPEYAYFKNSFVKNVAIVDGIPQGRGWLKNEGESGFGKWRFLPTPATISWSPGKNFDYYCGTHNGYDSLGVSYFREVYFIKEGFWIVKDNFVSEGSHDYYQIWQGHYKTVGENLHLKSEFENGSALDIFQLNGKSDEIENREAEGTGASIFISRGKENYSFITLLFPSKNKNEVPTIDLRNEFSISGWSVKTSETGSGKKSGAFESDANVELNKAGDYILLGVRELKINGAVVSFDSSADIILNSSEGITEIRIGGVESIACSINSAGAVSLNGKEINYDGKIKINPNDVLIVK